MKLKFWSPRELFILQAKYGLLTYRQLARLLNGRTWYAVRNQVRYLGLTRDSNLGRKYSVNKKFFSRITDVSAYWAGFIAADGNVRKNRLTIGLAPLDAEHLRQFRRDIEYNGPLSEDSKRIVITICCQEIVDDLRRNFSIVERKSLILRPPEGLRERHVKAFIRGLIDGDGSIYVRKPENYPRIILYGTRAICRWVRVWCDRWVPKTHYRRARETPIRNNSIWAYKVGARRAEALASLLLRVNGPKLLRKWSHFAQTTVTQ